MLARQFFNKLLKEEAMLGRSVRLWMNLFAMWWQPFSTILFFTVWCKKTCTH